MALNMRKEKGEREDMRERNKRERWGTNVA